MEGGLEELRILQTIILLITTSNLVHGESLGKVSLKFYNSFTTKFLLYIQFLKVFCSPVMIRMRAQKDQLPSILSITMVTVMYMYVYMYIAKS